MPGPGRSRAVLTVLAVLAPALVATFPAGGQPASPAAITFTPPCPDTVAAQPATITVTGTDFHPFSGVVVTFDAGPGGRPASAAAETDGFGRFSVAVPAGARPPGVHTVRADDLQDREATAEEFVPCHPGLALSPPVGPAGFVTEAVGRDFPPGAAVRLTWSPGITPPRSVVAGADGGFRVPVLIFPHDVNGPRRLRAEPAGTARFGSADAPFLVVRRTTVPGRKR